MTGAPKFNASARKNRVFTGELENRFWQLVEANRKRSEVVGQSEKQECNGAIIWRALREEGYAVSERTIRAKWAQYLRKRPEVFIRQEYEYGDRADFDFHQVKLKVSGKVAVYHQATISCPKSNHVFIALCPDETFARSRARSSPSSRNAEGCSTKLPSTTSSPSSPSTERRRRRC